jgi:uncharacterized Tic20 family protein
MGTIPAQPPSQDERLMAAFAHFSAFLPFTGFVVPVVIWVTQKEKSHYAASQALQAAVLQACMTAAWLIGMGIYIFSFLGIFLTMFFAPSGKTEQSTTIFVLLFLLAFATPFLVMAAMLIVRIAFNIYAIAATIITLQGKSFHYLLIGKWVERFIQPKPVVPQVSPPASQP